MAEVKSVATIKAEYEEQYPNFKSDFLAFCYLNDVAPWNFFGKRVLDYKDWSNQMTLKLRSFNTTEMNDIDRIWIDTYHQKQQKG